MNNGNDYSKPLGIWISLNRRDLTHSAVSDHMGGNEHEQGLINDLDAIEAHKSPGTTQSSRQLADNIIVCAHIQGLRMSSVLNPYVLHFCQIIFQVHFLKVLFFYGPRPLDRSVNIEFKLERIHVGEEVETCLPI